MAISNNFKNRLSQLVAESDFFKSDIAKDIGVGSSSFFHAVNYGILPSTRTLVKIADYFAVSIAYLLGETDVNEFIPATAPVTFYERFSELCKDKSVTHYKVGNDCGFDKSIISRWAYKGYLPVLEIVDILCSYFNVSADYLLGRTDFKH